MHINVRASKARQTITYPSFRSKPLSISPAAFNYAVESADTSSEYTTDLLAAQAQLTLIHREVTRLPVFS
jgi:hypothetical protein